MRWPLASWEDFSEKIVVDPGTGCYEWQGAHDASGYGRYRGEKAHRWAYENEVGIIAAGKVIDHLCRNPKCVRPEHLEPVTPKENVQRGALYTWPAFVEKLGKENLMEWRRLRLSVFQMRIFACMKVGLVDLPSSETVRRHLPEIDQWIAEAVR